MKIALDCRAVFKEMGGIGRYTWNLLKQLAVIDIENEYVCYFTQLPPPEPICLPKRFRIRTFDAGMIDERFDQLILPTLLVEDRVDVYHNPTFAVPLVRTPARIVSTIHDVVFKRHPDLVEPRLRTYLDRATLRARKGADHVITGSEFSRKELLELYPEGESEVTVIPHGVEPSSTAAPNHEIAFRTLAAMGLETGNYLLYVGSVETKKNVNIILQAFARISSVRACQGLRLAIAGPRNDTDYPLETRIVESGLEDRVNVLGYVPSEALECLYAHARVFIYPSLYEGFGLPPLEAMVRGIPTIVSDATSLPEVVGDGAILVDPTRADHLAEVIKELVENHDRCVELGARGRKRAAQFSWRRSAEEHLNVYKSVLRIHETAPSSV
jgi:glycosyltransferase involved in cell wall biosynthesis